MSALPGLAASPAAEEELLAAEAALVAGVERPRDTEAPVFGILGGSAETGAPPIEVPLPENALKPAAIEFELAAAVPLSLSAEVS